MASESQLPTLDELSRSTMSPTTRNLWIAYLVNKELDTDFLSSRRKRWAGKLEAYRPESKHESLLKTQGQVEDVERAHALGPTSKMKEGRPASLAQGFEEALASNDSNTRKKPRIGAADADPQLLATKPSRVKIPRGAPSLVPVVPGSVNNILPTSLDADKPANSERFNSEGLSVLPLGEPSRDPEVPDLGVIAASPDLCDYDARPGYTLADLFFPDQSGQA
mmetsp:Transcript_44286/g.118149  ORF Transcript_44286/g.118149 Transcript_44286/m.118149 type:complete len:222 (-) Transcript_44286:61-726(-)